MPENDTSISTWTAIRQVISFSGRHQAWLYIAIVVVLLGTAILIGSNWSMAQFVDAVMESDRDGFWFYLRLAVILVLIEVPFGYLQSYSTGQFSERTLNRLRQLVAEQVSRLPMDYLENRHTGDLLAVVNADLGILKRLTANSLVELVRIASTAIVALITLFIISWQLSLVSTILIPLMILITSRMNQPIARRTKQMQERIGDTVSVAQDGLSGIMVTKAFNLEKIMDQRFSEENRTALRQGLILARLRAVVESSSSIFGILPFLISMGFGGYLTITGQMTFGSLFLFINLLNWVTNPLYNLPPILANLGEASGAAQRMFDLLAQELERSDGQGFAVGPASGQILDFNQLVFAYDDKPVINRVSFEVKPGQKIALVGSSGSGKSTLLKLVLGYYPLETGSLKLFGHELSEWQLGELRQNLAFVSQDTYLFPVSVAENIACGRPGAEQAEIETAARLANIHDFIVSLPEGYQTLVGERGTRLSGGQRQRISLARAILKDAPVLLLDEPTSALDSESEALVQEALERVMEGRTTIVIAHRLSTIRSADRVLVMEAGQIIEDGTHNELLELDGRYRDLYLRQYAENGLTV